MAIAIQVVRVFQQRNYIETLRTIYDIIGVIYCMRYLKRTIYPKNFKDNILKELKLWFVYGKID